MRKDTKGKNRSRRDFMRKTAAASAFMIVPRHVLGGPAYVAPSDKVNIAAVGAGGKAGQIFNLYLMRTSMLSVI